MCAHVQDTNWAPTATGPRPLQSLPPGGAPGAQSWLLLGGGFGSEMMRAVQDGEEKVVGAGLSGHMGTTAIIPWPGVEGPLPTE